jgi:D-glycero-alpha-D-manno-heptose-7-phosphate kinase
VTVNLAIDVATQVVLRPSAGEYRLLTDERVRTTRDLAAWLKDPSAALVGHLASSLALEAREIEVHSDSPRGGGLGASSALAVAFVVAAESYTGTSAGTVASRSRFARDVEARLMGLPTGRQDHLPALCGGLLAIEHRPGGELVSRLEVDWEALSRSLVVAYSGKSHFSAGNNWRIVRRRLDGDPAVVENFEQIAATARSVVEAFRAGSLGRVGELMSLEWTHRRQLAEGISTPRIETMLRVAIENGAWGGKACGAGGGGCVVVLTPPEKRRRVVAALAQVAEVLPAGPRSGPFELHRA